MTSYSLVVTINGTNKNPWNRWGLKCNPFPQTGKAEFWKWDQVLQALDSDPIKDLGELKERLRPFVGPEAQEFVDLCCQQFRPGERVSFEVRFPV